MYAPPYSDPIRPYADPLMWRELSWYGAHIAYKLEEAGKSGILNAAQYPGWGHFGWHWITPFHNITGMLTESASASPLRSAGASGSAAAGLVRRSVGPGVPGGAAGAAP